MFQDLILPFSVSRETALTRMQEYISKHRLLIQSDFETSLTLERIRGVYLPYIPLDANLHVRASGIGKKRIQGRRYDKESRASRQEFSGARDLDLTVDDLAIESAKKWDSLSKSKGKARQGNSSLLSFSGRMMSSRSIFMTEVCRRTS